MVRSQKQIDGYKAREHGVKGERRVGKILSMWWCGDKIHFRRTPLSGGFGAGKVGDLMCPYDFPCIVEIKHVEGWDFEPLLTGKNPMILKWWDDHTEDAVRREKHPLLIFTKRYHPDFIMMPWDPFDFYHLKFKRAWRMHWHDFKCGTKILRRVSITLLEDFCTDFMKQAIKGMDGLCIDPGARDPRLQSGDITVGFEGGPDES